MLRDPTGSAHEAPSHGLAGLVGLIAAVRGSRIVCYGSMDLEVDHTTDVRRSKLALYEAWGFPEVWVEVPEIGTRSRPKGLLPGLTIYRLESGKYWKSAVSGAFPGWRAADIHEALNEEEGCSERTVAIVEHVGRRLGMRERTGPDHDPLLRSLRM